MPVIFAVMAYLNYIIWNGSPEIFSVNSFALRWYGLFFALGFLISQQILYYMYRKEGKPEKDVDTLTIYMVIATIIGARLGHVIFYDPQIIWEEPLNIFLPFEFSPFRFTGLQGLASHGGAIGILFALWLYANYSITFSKPAEDQKGATPEKPKMKSGFFIKKRKKQGQSYFQVLDRIVILVALTGALIRLGNYFNSEIIGKPTESTLGVVFVNKLTEAMEDRQGDPEVIESIVYHANDSLPKTGNGRVPLSVYVFFKPGVTEDQAHRVMGDARNFAFRLDEFFDPTEEIDYEVAPQEDGNLAARLHVTGISRHPAQLYESIACVILFILLYAIWSSYKNSLPAGRLLGIFLIWCFGLRFLFEFLKENQESFEDSLPINMGQILSIPLVIAGILVLLYSFGKRAKQNT